MANDKVQLFEDQPIRTAWVEDEEEWYFSIVDVTGVLTEQIDYRTCAGNIRKKRILRFEKLCAEFGLPETLRAD